MQDRFKFRAGIKTKSFSFVVPVCEIGKDVSVYAFLNEEGKLEAEFGENLQEISTEYELFVFFADELNRKYRKIKAENTALKDQLAEAIGYGEMLINCDTCEKPCACEGCIPKQLLQTLKGGK